MCQWVSFKAHITADQKEHKDPSFTNLDDLLDFGENILWIYETKVELFGRHIFCFMLCQNPTVVKLKERNIIMTL